MPDILTPSKPAFNFIYLASQSPRRRELLTQVGVGYELLLPDETEDAESLEAVLPHEAPQDYVLRVTSAKLKAAVKRFKDRQLLKAPILCSDTTVVLDGVIFGKPSSPDHACQMLQQMQGRVHQVMTAVAAIVPDDFQNFEEDSLHMDMHLSVSQVKLAPMSSLQIEHYVKSGESMGKAGAYAIQGRMAAFIEHISGSYSGIMGLPLYETMSMLYLMGVEQK